MSVIVTDRGFAPDDFAAPVRPLAEAAMLEAGQGVVVGPGDDLRVLAPHLDRVALVRVLFPAFSDGRGFSQAMLLRERLGYKGELRAVGTVLLDQVPLMLRTGFDSFEVHHAPTIERLVERRLPGIDLHYQPSADRTDTTTGYSWRCTAILNG